MPECNTARLLGQEKMLLYNHIPVEELPLQARLRWYAYGSFAV